MRWRYLMAVGIVVAALAAALINSSWREREAAASSRTTENFSTAPGESALGAGPNASADYLSRDLRAAVEQLKEDVAKSPTDPATAKARAAVLWKWGNAFAMQGGILPVELPLECGRILADWPFRGGNRELFGRFDGFIHELALREERPDAIGTLVADNEGPFVAGSYQTIRQTYTVGRMPLIPGGGVLLAKHFMADHAPFQTTDPMGDNYVTIAASNPEAKFEVSSRPVFGMHGGLFAPVRQLTFRLEEGTLGPGESFTVTYGDTSGGSKGFRVQTYSNERFPLPVYVDLEGKGNFFTLPIVAYRVVGEPVAGVHGFVPSVVGVGESFELSVRSQDRYYNRATGPIPAYDVLLGEVPVASVPAGADSPEGETAISIVDELEFKYPGVYRYTIRSEDGTITGMSNPVWVREDASRRIYWGETHGHSGFAEGQGTPDAYFRFGRDDARLDFLTHSEHDLWMDDLEWKTLKENVAKYNDEGKFIALLGYEWTMRAEQGGHHNVFFRTAEGRDRVPLQEAPVLSALYQQLAEKHDMRDVLIIPHAHEPGDYRFSHPKMEHLIEIMSMHGRHEWFGVMYLNHGHQVGFVAASDDHLSHPGYPTPMVGGLADSGGLAAVIAPEKTTDAIFDAMKNLSAYATTGDRILLDFTLNGGVMGTRVPYADERRIVGSVHGTAPIDTITIVKNGKPIWTNQCLNTEARRFVEVRFRSPSDPVIRDSPRAWRPWQGEITVAGAKVLAASAPSLYNPRAERIRFDGETGRASFRLITRGSEKGVLLELDGATDDTEVHIELESTTERYTTPSRLRRAATLPAESLTFSLGEIDAGTAVRQFNVDRFTDEVDLRRVDPAAAYDQSFEFVDNDSPQHGDYYYVRVRQLNGAEAWSSPVWLGSYPPK